MTWCISVDFDWLCLEKESKSLTVRFLCFRQRTVCSVLKTVFNAIERLRNSLWFWRFGV